MDNIKKKGATRFSFNDRMIFKIHCLLGIVGSSDSDGGVGVAWRRFSGIVLVVVVVALNIVIILVVYLGLQDLH